MARRARLTERIVLRWADAHHRRTGAWPNQRSGVVRGQEPLTWRGVHSSLYAGGRGLSSGSSLARLLERERGVENYLNPRPVRKRELVHWARAHKVRTGQWPHKRSGAIVEVPNLSWATLDTALKCGSRGLPSRTSLAAFLEEHAGARTRRTVPVSSVRQILRWADEHRRRTGLWPMAHDGPVFGVEGESWLAIDKSLRVGTRGLPGGSSLPRLLLEHRRKEILRDARTHEALAAARRRASSERDYAQRKAKRQAAPRMIHLPRPRMPPPSITEVLTWMDAHHDREGHWPNVYSGRVRESPGFSWARINNALRVERSLAPGTYGSLLALLRIERGVWDSHGRPVLSEALVLRWAKAHLKRTGRWPDSGSGAVPEWPGETWSRIRAAFSNGSRGLRKGRSLHGFLLPERLAQRDPRVRSISVDEVLAWVDAHQSNTGDWPRANSGVVGAEPSLTWQAVHAMLAKGSRGLPGKTTLVRFLAKHRGRRSMAAQPRLTIARILKWADAHRARTGRWPRGVQEPVFGAPGEKWKLIDWALHTGSRGLVGGTTLNRILVRHRGKRDPRNPPPLTIKRVKSWILAYRAKHRKWPDPESGKIDGAGGETWSAVNQALRHSRRGLRFGASLNKFMLRHCGMYTRRHRPPLSAAQILTWADRRFARTGDWPTVQSGRIAGSKFDSWQTVHAALRNGGRGLKGGSSLHRFLLERRGALYRQRRVPLAIDEILEWAADHHEQTGRLPVIASGPVRGQDGETWLAIDAALRTGKRNLRGGSSLPRLLAGRYQDAYPGLGQPLTVEKINGWANDFRSRAGAWPTKNSAYVFPPRRGLPERQGERWFIVDMALREGLRGLPGGSSLAQVVRLARTQRIALRRRNSGHSGRRRPC